MIEAVISTALALVLVGLAFTFFVQARKGVASEQSGIDLQQAARVSVDELARQLQQVGYGVDRSISNNPSEWQKSLIYGGPHAIAMNMDVDSTLGPMDSSVTLTFPTGETYDGEGGGGTTNGAETYYFSLDANGDGTITLNDRTAAAKGSFNPAADTENPLDFAVFRRVYGYDGTSQATQLAPMTPYLFTNAVSGIKYADGDVPEPLFTYLMTEDVNVDGVLDPSECVNDVVDTCPPATPRAPLLYIWGDSNFDDELSNAERATLLKLPVGSPNWSKSPIASGGTAKKTTVAANFNPSVDGRVMEVQDASKLTIGSYVKLGSGFTEETVVVQAVRIKAGNDIVSLSSQPKFPHAAGASVEVAPDTLLRAVRAIQINFTAISPKKDSDNGHAPVGRTGRKTDHGMDYRTLTLQRTVHLINQATVPLAGGGAGSGYIPPATHCPLTLVTECAGTSPSQFYSVGGTVVPVQFRVTDASNQNAEGVRVSLAQSNDVVGKLDTTDALVDAAGLVTAIYTPSSTLGSDTIEATTTCGGDTYTASVTIDTASLRINATEDCVEMPSSRNPNPGTSYFVQVQDGNGSVVGAPVSLHLEIDSDYLSPKDFSGVQADLYADGGFVASTDASGMSTPYVTKTGMDREVTGTVNMSTDYSDGGTRVKLVASVPDETCYVYGAEAVDTIDFYKMELESLSPYFGCVEGSPCNVGDSEAAPDVKVTLSQAGQPVAGATVLLTTEDNHEGPNDPPAESNILPSATLVTDDNGEALATIGNNGSASITSEYPLQTVVDASSAGDPGICNSPSINATSLRPAFRFAGETEAAACGASIDQAYLSLPDPGKPDKQCLHAFNDAAEGGCPSRLVGIKLELYTADGSALDHNFQIEKIEGGTIDSLTSCDNGAKEILFEDDCTSWNGDLPNGQRWDFTTVDKCDPPPFDIDPQKFFVFNRVEWRQQVPAGRRMDVTLYWDCVGDCAGVEGLEQRYELVTP